MAGQFLGEHGLGQGAQDEAVLRRDQVQRAPHDDDAHHGPLFEQQGQGRGLEAGQAGPQAQVGVLGQLGLEAEQAPDGSQRGTGVASQQQLAFQGGPVQGPIAEDIGAHLVMMARPDDGAVTMAR